MNNHIFPFLWMRGEDESILRNEIEKIYECGIRAVCLEARPHDEFCKEGWWRDVDIVLDEAKKRGMKIWILDDKHFPTGYANGLILEKYPERRKLYINKARANVTGYPGRKLTLNIARMLKPAIGFWEIEDSFQNMQERAANRLFSVVAVRLGEGEKVHEETIDLTDTLEGNYVSFTLPEGVWTVYVLYKTRTDGGEESYINMIDAESAHTQIEGVYESHYARYAEEFGTTIAGFFSDEPQFGNINEVCYDAALGKKKMPLPWSDELEQLLSEKYGEGYRALLPYLFQESEERELQIQFRYDYMDCVSRLYKKNFSDPIGQWCEDHGVEYIGHVVEDNGVHSRLGMGAAHFFRAMSGQHMAGIDCIGEQIVYGAPAQARLGMGELGGDGEFHHYTLGKLGASSGHLDPKKKGRTMCELFGAYGWNFGVRDMKYVLDHLLVKGVNELVPHAFSMAEYPDQDCPPHFYARGNNPQFVYFAELMKYANRMCDLLSNGQHCASVAVLYDGEADWVGGAMPMQKVNRQLIDNQIDFDIVCLDMLENLDQYNGRIEDAKLVVNGVTFEALVVPYTRAIPAGFLSFVRKKGSFPVIFVDGYPDVVIHENGAGALADLMENCEVQALSELPLELRARGMYEITLSEKFDQLSFYHYVKDRHIFVFQNESAARSFHGSVILPVKGEFVYYNAGKDRYESADCKAVENGTELRLDLELAECLVLVEKKDLLGSYRHISFEDQRKGTQELDLSSDWNVSKAKAIAYPKFDEPEKMKKLTPISDENVEFSGIIRYVKSFELDQVPKGAYLKAEQVYQVMKVTVNGKDAGMCLTPPYQVELSGLLQAGTNELMIEVATTSARDQLIFPQPPFDFSYEAMEAAGMCGTVILYLAFENTGNICTYK